MRGEAWPDATNADELHDALAWLGFLTEDEVAAQPGWAAMLDALARDRRVARLGSIWITAERLLHFRAVFPDAPLKWMPPTKHMTGDVFRGNLLDGFFNLVGALTGLAGLVLLPSLVAGLILLLAFMLALSGLQLAALAIVAIVRLSGPSEFLYWQF